MLIIKQLPYGYQSKEAKSFTNPQLSVHIFKKNTVFLKKISLFCKSVW